MSIKRYTKESRWLVIYPVTYTSSPTEILLGESTSHYSGWTCWVFLFQSLGQWVPGNVTQFLPTELSKSLGRLWGSFLSLLEGNTWGEFTSFGWWQVIRGVPIRNYHLSTMKQLGPKPTCWRWRSKDSYAEPLNSPAMKPLVSGFPIKGETNDLVAPLRTGCCFFQLKHPTWKSHQHAQGNCLTVEGWWDGHLSHPSLCPYIICFILVVFNSGCILELPGELFKNTNTWATSQNN